MNETQTMHLSESQCELRHVEARDIFRKDLVLDKHSHKIAYAIVSVLDTSTASHSRLTTG